MGQRPRPRPRHLAAKLLAIRQKLGASQSQMAKLLEFKVSYSRVSEYESGVREPNLLVLLSYARIAGVSMDILVNDRLELPNTQDSCTAP
jgi:transcriptional regulator with XRE-family HTH domain